MEYDFDICQLSPAFYAAYPAKQYPEIMRKRNRPYTCLLIELYGSFVCIPFRSSIHHKEAFLFKNTKRSQQSNSGLDYKKMVIIDDMSYIIFNGNTVVDADEYVMTARNMPTIAAQVAKYIDRYVKHVSGKRVLHPREYARRYQYSTLPYFHDMLDL